MKGEEQSNLGDAARAAALEKELMRLKSINRKQSVKYNRLKKIFFFTNIFIIILFVMMFSYRMILAGKQY
jgi:t-SNARE complex subunit (syntaxin)